CPALPCPALPCLALPCLHRVGANPVLVRETKGSGISLLVTSTEGNLEKPDQETSEAASAFLYTGDPSKLTQVNCTRRVEIRGMRVKTADVLHPYLHGAKHTLIHATNFLNLIFQTDDIRESSVKDDIEWYHALVRSIIEGDPQIYRTMLTFDSPPISSKPQLVLQATRYQNEIFLQDLSSTSDYLENQTSESEWFNGLKYQRTPYLNKRILNNDLKTLDTPKWNQGDSYLMDEKHIKWSMPFMECENYKFFPGWMVTMSSSFYGLKPDLSPEFKGVIRIDINLQSVDINQCSPGDSWFADSHQCDLNSTECVPLQGQGFQLGAYQCVCQKGFYNPNVISTNGFSSKYLSVEEARELFECRACGLGCSRCTSDAPCLVQEDEYLRVSILTCQAFCMLLVFLSMLVAYHYRRNKRIRASGLILLETILGGSILLYFPVFILYFTPSVFRCILLRWVRMLGFAVIYGTITLKMYRVLKVFLSRTAQRVPYMTCCRVLKMLGVIILTVCWFLIAWTVAVWENMERRIPLIVQSQTPDGQSFNTCQLDRWDYMMAVAELLLLCWASYLCYAVRTVPSAFHEPRFMGLAIHNEIVMSAAFHMTSLHPDWMLLLFFVHTHLTVTMTLALLFIPKFLHVGMPLREEIAAEVYEDELDMRRSGSYLNSSITSAWSDHSLDPDDIRDELKKLYGQLEVHKTKKMTANNPHLQKKRSSRRTLGRSIMKRISEFPESMSRQHGKDERDGRGSYPGSYKKKTYDPTSFSLKVKEDSIKHRVLSLRKSHSTYDHVRDHRDGSTSKSDTGGKDPSLLDSLMRKKLAKKVSAKSDTDSVDSSRSVCKSASAHNLSVDIRPLCPKMTTLQKSRSVSSSSKEKALLISKSYLSVESARRVRDKVQKNPASKRASRELQSCTLPETSKKQNVSPSTRQRRASEVPRGSPRSLLEDNFDNFDKAEVCPWELQDLPPSSPDNRSQKHVRYAPVKCISVDSSHLSGKQLQETSRKKFGKQAVKYTSMSRGSVDNITPWPPKELSPEHDTLKPSTDTHHGANRSPKMDKSMERPRAGSICDSEHEERSNRANKAEISSEKTDHISIDSFSPDSKWQGSISRSISNASRTQPSPKAAIICPWEFDRTPSKPLWLTMNRVNPIHYLLHCTK
uniref:G-protein coupled receptors family 3 profile domain-containing protein n=1 Tax=Callorhinchus milii TaxID=7868 RepID=A0A4W3JXW1_CALMI